MNLKFRIIIYCVVAFLLPLLIWLVYREIPTDAWLWMVYALVLLGGGELVSAWLKRKRRS